MDFPAHQPRRISDIGLDLIKLFEALRLTAYKDSVGVWTIGYGHTGDVDGAKVVKGMRITEEHANDLLSRDVGVAEVAVSDSVDVSVNDNQFAALVSFTFNVGSGSLRRSTLLRKLNGGDYIGAADQFVRWNKAAGKTLLGLTRRRAAERKLFTTITQESAEIIVETEQNGAIYQDSPKRSKRLGSATLALVSVFAIAFPAIGIDISEDQLSATSDAVLVAIQAGSAAIASLLALWSKISDQRMTR